MPHKDRSDNPDVIEFDYGGTPLSDKGSVEDIQRFIDSPGQYMGKDGMIEAMWLVEGVTPWPGPPFPRPVYRVRFRYDP